MCILAGVESRYGDCELDSKMEPVPSLLMLLGNWGGGLYGSIFIRALGFCRIYVTILRQPGSFAV